MDEEQLVCAQVPQPRVWRELNTRVVQQLERVLACGEGALLLHHGQDLSDRDIGRLELED